MLTYIHIKNFVIVQSLSLDFHEGLHVLTGETGAGKSIWIDAIEIGLGGRADSSMIFPGEKTCHITLCFDLRKLPQAKAWLSEQGLPIDEECIIRRTLDREKPSRTTLNGVPIPQQLMREFSEFILSIHGQHAHQRLLKAEEQRHCLDTYADHTALLNTLKAHYDKWASLENEYQRCIAQSQQKNADLTLWRYQLSELNELHLVENEYDDLFLRYQNLQRNKQFSSQLQTALHVLTQEEFDPITAFEQSLQLLKQLRTEDTVILNIQELLQTTVIHAQEAKESLQKYCDHQEMDEENLVTIEKRLNQLQDVARKHHVDPTQLSAVITTLSQNIQILENVEEHLAALEKEKNAVLVDFQKEAAKLSDSRKKAAKKLSALVTEQLQQLGMEGSEFIIDCVPIKNAIHPQGLEQITFLITTNKGQKPHALSDIISGGELSRLSLTLQTLMAHKNNTPTLIFDEVDVGIGGKTADLIGRLLRSLSTHAQVLCVTHLAQVAACGHHHYQAEKTTTQNLTFTTMKLLNTKERTSEIARMLSGATITEKSIQHANELLNAH